MPKLTDGLVASLSDWLSLFDGPKNKPFSEIVEQEDWTRLFRLLLLVLMLSGAVLGAKITIAALQHAVVASVLESPVAIAFVVVGAMLSVAYSSVARVFGIKLSLKKSFFIIMSLLLPWVPIANCVDAIQSLPSFKGISVVFFLGHLLLIRPIYNFYQGVVISTQAAKWRALCSILLPLILFGVLAFYMFG